MNQTFFLTIAAMFSVAQISGCAATAPLPDACSLWSEYALAPDTHPNIPNNSYAGYQYGEKPIPSFGDAPVFNVKNYGAKGDSGGDDSPAVEKALRAAKAHPRSVIFFPPGTYSLANRIVLDKSRLVLRGAGSDKTFLYFLNPLPKIQPRDALPGGRSPYSWSGGLIHIGPDVSVAQGWGARQRIAVASGSADRGSREIQVNDVSKIRDGQWIFLVWNETKQKEILNFIAGKPAGSKLSWAGEGKAWANRRLPWPVQVEKVKSDRTVVLRQPLRMPIGKNFPVSVFEFPKVVEETGVEGLTIGMNTTEDFKHMHAPGFNAVFFHRAIHSWARDIAIQDADNGVLLDSTKNVSIERLQILGTRRYHHGTYSKDSHDTLVSDFEISAPMIHGINADIFGTGNVWRRGRMLHGSFDLHHGMQFDLIRTDITIHNDGRIGGENESGPMQGIRVNHWNIRFTGQVDGIYQPEWMPMGALVGVQGAQSMASQPANGCIEAATGKVPDPPDLYEAQLKLRLEK